MKHTLFCIYLAVRLMFFITGCSDTEVIKAQLVETERPATSDRQTEAATDLTRQQSEEIDRLISDGLILYRQHDYEAAVNEFRSAVAIDPENWRGYYFLGLVKTRQEEYGVADAFLHESLSLAPADKRIRSQIYSAIAANFEDQQLLAQAEQHFRTALKLHPDSFLARRGLERVEQSAALPR